MNFSARTFAAVLLSLVSASAVHAAGSQLMGVVPGGTPCYADPQRGIAGYQTGNIEFFLENLTDGLLPNPVTITGSTIWVQGGVPSTIFGNLSMAIDPQQVYAKTAGYPAYQYYVVNTFKTLAVMQLQPSNAGQPNPQQYMGNQFVWQTLPQPFDYYPGDAIAFAPECAQAVSPSSTVASMTWSVGVVTMTTSLPHNIAVGGGTNIILVGASPDAYNGVHPVVATSPTKLTFPMVSNPGVAISPGYWADGYVIPTLVSVTMANPDIPPLPYVLNLPASAMKKTVNPGYSIRNLLPAATAASSKIRVKLLHAFDDSKSSRITNMAVCIQAAPGSPNCTAKPVPMLCFQASWTIVYPSQTLWCDWTDFSLSPGQVPLVIADVFTPSEDGMMHWSYNDTTGLGDWASPVPGYNQATMGGTPTWQPNRTQVIYGAQVQ